MNRHSIFSIRQRSIPAAHPGVSIPVYAAARLLTGIMIIALVTGCSKSDSNNDPGPDPEPAISIQLKTDATLGSILTDKDGRTLYYFSNDAAGENTCTGGCEQVWPPLLTSQFNVSRIGTGLSDHSFRKNATNL